MAFPSAALSSLVRGAARGAIAARWGIAVVVLAYVVFSTMFNTTSPGSDGHYTWLFTRSLVYDHDIDFTNDYRICGDPYDKNHDRGTGHPDNPFYVGPTVTWAPLLWVMKTVTTLPADAPEQEKQACRGPITARTLWLGTVLGALTIGLMYRIGRRYADDGPAALAAGLLGFASSLPAYAAIMPSYSHVHDAFWAGVTVLSAQRASERPRSIPRWALAGAAVGIGLLQRPVSVAYGIVPAALALAVLWRQWRTLALAFAAMGAGAFLCGALPQMLVYKYLYGSFWAGAPHGHLYMQYAHAHPWLVLFAPHGGLFYTAPVVWLAVPGAVVALRERSTRAFAGGLLLAAAATVWLSSAPIDWHGSGTFGARRLTSLLPLLAAPAAIALARANRWLRARPARARTALGVAVFVPIAFTIVGASYGLGLGRVTTEWGLPQAGLYGVGEEAAWSFVDDHVGDLSLLPAEAIFHLRYGLPMSSWRDATEPLYQRNYRTLQWERGDIDLTRKQHANLVTGFDAEEDGMHVQRRRATLVFAAQWPFATSVTVKTYASRETRLRVALGRTFGASVGLGEVTAGPQEATSVLSIPAGAFDSGLVEIVFERIDLAGELTIRWVKVDDASSHPGSM